jgi:diacylglycerol kinase (ATP)
MKRATLIHNPQAGDEDHSRRHLVKLIRDAGYEVDYKSSKDDLGNALEDPGDLVVVAGGDGTVRKVALQLLDHHAPLAILPTGTANNISKSLGIDGSPEELIEGWKRAEPKRFSVASAKSCWGQDLFVEAIGLGLLSRTISILNKVDHKADVDFANTEHKVGRDLTALIVLLSEYTPMDLKVSIDGREISAPLLLFEIMNIKQVGPNLLLAPDADPGDDYLDCVFLVESNRENFAKYLTGLMAGKQVTLPVDIVKGKQIEFHWEGTAIHLDDKIWTKGITVPPPPQQIDVELDGRWFEYLSTEDS